MNPLIIAAISYGATTLKTKVTPAAAAAGKRLVFDVAKKSIQTTSQSTKKVILSDDIEVMKHDLSVPRNFIEHQIVRIGEDVESSLAVVKGQNEIHFLSNSIDYFLKAHEGRTGIDRGISYSLQYDIAAVIKHVSQNQDLRFPGYMSHQVTALGSTIAEYNVFYDAVLNDGHVRTWTREAVVRELERTYGPHRKPNPVKPYMPYAFQVDWLRKKENKETATWRRRLPFFNDAQVLHAAHDALLVLSEELIASEALEQRLVEKLSHLPENQIAIVPKSQSTESE